MTRISPAFPIVAGALALTFLWVVAWYWPTAADVAGIWWRSDTFAHGLIVLPAFAWLTWHARERIGGLRPQPVAWMAMPILAAGLLWLLGSLVSVAAAQHFALFVMLVSAFVGVLGWRLSRILLFPLAFLFFGVPIGEFLLPTLMHYTAEFTVWALRLSGVPVYQEGLFFIVPNGSWSVVEACSGIRYLIASLVVGALYAYLNYTSLKRRLLFMLVALAMPIVANWVRAYIIVMLGYLSDNNIAAGVDHLIYGWVFFGVVIFLMFWVGSRWQEEPAQLRSVPVATTATRWVGVVPIALALAAFPPALAIMDRPIDAFAVTLDAPAPAEGWTTAPAERFAYVPHYAGARAQLRQTYLGEGRTAPVGLFAAWYLGQREGQEMIAWENGPASHVLGDLHLVRSAHAMTVAGVPVVENFIFTPSGRVLTWHWYRLNDRELARDAEVKLRLAVDRLTSRPDESAVVVLSTPVAEEGPERARARLEAFLVAHAGAIRATLEAPAASIPR